MCATKTDLRSQFNSYRRTLSDLEHRHLSRRIIERVAGLPEIQEAKVVHLYWPMMDRREVDTRLLIELLQDQGKEIILPVVAATGAVFTGASRMEHVRYVKGEHLRANRWGIDEPIRGESVAVEDLDAVVAPALGAGRSGHRIGYGYGFYDEFLAQTSVTKIAPVYDACLVDAVPVESHDIPMDILVTESTIVRPLPPNSGFIQ